MATRALAHPRNAAPPAEHAETTWVRRLPLLTFFVLAFGLTWAIMVPLILSSWGPARIIFRSVTRQQFP